MNSSNSKRIPLSRRFKFKLYLLTLVSLLLLLATEILGIYKQKQDLYDGKKGTIQSAVEVAHGILEHYEELIDTGKLSPEMAREQAYATIRILRFGSDLNNSVNILDAKTGRFIAHADKSYEGNEAFANTRDPLNHMEHLQIRLDGMAQHAGRFIYQAVLPKPVSNGEMIDTTRITSYYMFEPWGVIVASGIWTDDVDAEFANEVTVSIVIMLTSSLGLLLFAAWLNRALIKQIGGEPIEALKIMEATAQGDFTQRIKKSIPGSLLGVFTTMSESIRSMIQDIGTRSKELSNSANSIDHAMDKVSEAAETQSKATASIAAAVEQFTVSVHNISDAAQESEKISQEVAQLCQQGDRMVTEAHQSMQGIEQAVQNASDKITSLESRAAEISTIASSISEIAAQTNLLALNAAIEAARAGEQGRGFSVVADEVRKLAERTTAATSEIESMIIAVQEETRESTEMMSRVTPLVKLGSEITHKITEALRDIHDKADMTLSRIQEVSHAAHEQSVASTSISQRVESVAQMVEQTSVVLGDTNRSIEHLRDTSDQLSEIVNKFKV